MFIGFLHQLKEAGVPVSIREYLDFLSGLDKGITNLNTNSFYHFARASLVKDERHYDRFDRTFSEWCFGGAAKDLNHSVLLAILSRDFKKLFIDFSSE